MKRPPKPPGKLTDKQARFVEEYLVDLDPAAAYQRAGYKPKGNKAARNAASRLLANVGVGAAIQAGKSARSKRTQIDQDYVLVGLRAEAEDHGEGSSSSARVTALTRLGQHLGMFVNRHELSTPPGAPLLKGMVFVVRDSGAAETAPGPGRPALGTNGPGGPVLLHPE
jgi:hypothetical protein